MKDTEQYFPVVLLVMLHKVVLGFVSADKILKCEYSNVVYVCLPVVAVMAFETRPLK